MNNLALFTGHIGHKGDGVADARGINNIIKLSPLFENPKPKEGLPTIAPTETLHPPSQADIVICMPPTFSIRLRNGSDRLDHA